MNIIPQMNLFEESEFDDFGDLERLQQLLSVLNDGKLIHRLYKKRTGVERINGWVDRD